MCLSISKKLKYFKKMKDDKKSNQTTSNLTIVTSTPHPSHRMPQRRAIIVAIQILAEIL